MLRHEHAGACLIHGGLHIDASILAAQSASRQLTAAIVKRLLAVNPATEVVYQDLAAEPAGHLSAEEFMAFQGVEPQDDATKRDSARNAQWLDQFLAADVIVVGAPMYNFSLPTQLRAWLDRLAVPARASATALMAWRDWPAASG